MRVFIDSGGTADKLLLAFMMRIYDQGAHVISAVDWTGGNGAATCWAWRRVAWRCVAYAN